MKKRSKSGDTEPSLRDKIVGMGERSIRKNYYPQMQKQLEDMEAVRKELAESQASYRSLVENINDVIFSLDAEGEVTYISPVIQSLSGFTPDEVIGRSFKEFVHPDDLSAVEANFKHILIGEPNPFEYRVRSKDGEFRYVHSSSRPLLKDGKVVGLTGVMSDITELQRAEKQRQEHLHFMESMDRVNRAMQKADDLDEMMSAVLDEVLDIFGCDRTALVYPCDPKSTMWTARMERTRPEYPGILSLGIEMPIETEAKTVFGAVLDSDSPVGFGPGAIHSLPALVAERFGVRSMIAMPIHPKGDKPWMFVLHQCAYPRVWAAEEARLFKEIGRRITDGLTGLLIMRELRESEAKYRRFVETSNEGVCALDRNSMITFANDRTFEMIGYSLDEMVGKSLTDFMFDSDIADQQQHMAVRRHGMAEHYEQRFRRKDGSELWLLISASAIQDEEGNFQGSFAMFSDITERKQAEEKVLQSEQRLRLHTELSPLGFLEWDENFCATEWNAACEKIFGYTREEALGRHAKDLILPVEVQGLVDEIYHNLMNQAGGRHSINENVTKDGRTIIVEWFNTTLINKDGQAIGVASICRDITERKQTEERLALLSFALNNVREAAFLVDEQARFHFVNEESCRILGYSREELLSMGVEDVDPDFPAERWPAHWQQLMEKKSLTFEGRHKTKEGRIFPIEISANFIDYAGQQYNLALVRDITERKQSEQALKEKQELLLEAQRIAHLGSWHMDLATNQVFWSEELYKMYGYDPALPPPLYTESAKLFTAESWERLNAAIAQAVEAGAPYELELEMVPKTGGRKWMLARGELVRDGQGRPASLRGVVQDITERKQAEKELLANEQLFRALVENSPDFIARYDREYRRIYVNPAIQKLFTADTDNVLGQTPADQSPVNMPQAYIEHLEKVFETGKESMLETLFRTAQGEMHWGQIRFTPELDADGNVASVLTIGRDIHEIKESEQRLRRFIANLPAFFFTFRRTGDGRYCFPYASPGIQTIYGFDPEDVREDMMPLHMLAHPDDRPHIEAIIVQAFETREPFNVEFRVCRPDMPERWIEARSIAHEETDGSILWYGIMLDITKRKQAEKELEFSEEKFSKAFYASPNLMAITSPEDGRIIEINESFCRFFGYEREECIGRNTAELHMWVDQEQRTAALRKLEKTGTALYVPVDLRTKSGEIRSVIDSMIFIDLGNQKRLLSVATDITERKQAEERLQESLVDTIRAIALMVEKRDPYTAGHQNRVSRLCVAIGGELGLEAERIEGLRLGAMIHDIGKVYVPAEILNRPGKLQAAEVGIVRSHPQVGYEILESIKFPWPVAEMILQHHERMDGSGYPGGLKGQDTLLESRIIAVADVVEAMSSHRPYRPALGIDAALGEIESQRGTKYDPEVVDACLRLFRERDFGFD